MSIRKLFQASSICLSLTALPIISRIPFLNSAEVIKPFSCCMKIPFNCWIFKRSSTSVNPNFLKFSIHRWRSRLISTPPKSIRRFLIPLFFTMDETPIIRSHVCQSSGSVRNTAPPNCTIRNCPTRMANTINSIPYDLERPLNAESVVPNTRALNRFQNCSMTKKVKKTVRLCISIPCVLWSK